MQLFEKSGEGRKVTWLINGPKQLRPHTVTGRPSCFPRRCYHNRNTQALIVGRYCFRMESTMHSIFKNCSERLMCLSGISFVSAMNCIGRESF